MFLFLINVVIKIPENYFSPLFNLNHNVFKKMHSSKIISYYFREEDVQWFFSIHPHLRTPESVIRAERLETQHRSPILDISNTPNVKQRKPRKTAYGKPPKMIVQKLEFSSSEDEEITAMLREHNKKVMSRKIDPPKVEPTVVSSVSTQPKPVMSKRRSCLPLLMKNKTAGPLIRHRKLGTFSQTNDVSHPLAEESTTSPQSVPFKSSSQCSGIQNSVSQSSVISPRSCSALRSSSQDSKPEAQSTEPPVQPIIKTAKCTISTKRSSELNVAVSKKAAMSSRKSVIIKPSCRPTVSETEPLQSKSAPSRTVAGKVASSKAVRKPVSSKPVSGKAVVSKPVIKSNTSDRPQTSKMIARKVAVSSSRARPPSKSTSAKNTSVKNASSKNTAVKNASVKIALDNKTVQTVVAKRPPSRGDGPFCASKNVLSIINSKTPGKLKSENGSSKPRYSVETPTPPRTAPCESSDDSEDLDEYLSKKLKAHNAKVRAKMLTNNRIPGKVSKTGKQVSLHLGSPSRPKMKPVRPSEN